MPVTVVNGLPIIIVVCAVDDVPSKGVVVSLPVDHRKWILILASQ